MNKAREGNLDNCLKCSTCHTQCPVVANYIHYPGPKYLGPEMERLRLARGERAQNSLAYCTNCKRCDIACPHGVKPSYYNLKNKAKIKLKPTERFRDWILAHNGWWGALANVVPGLSNLALKLPLTKLLMGIMGIAPRNFPRYNRQRIKINHERQNKKVLYYPGCYARFNEPEIIQAAVDILEKHGYYVKIAPVECCGTPIFSNGLLEEATRLAGKNRDIFLSYADRGYKIVTTCPSCGLALKEEYRDIIPGEKADGLSKGVWELFELLEEEDLFFNTDMVKIDKAYYHVPCHLKVQGIGYPGVRLLRKLAVDNLILEDSYCCGLSGTYGFKKEKYDLSMDIGAPLFEAINRSKADLVITDCGTCKLQIEQETKKIVKHSAVILREYLLYSKYC